MRSKKIQITVLKDIQTQPWLKDIEKKDGSKK